MREKKDKITDEMLQKVVEGLAINTHATDRNSLTIAQLEKAFSDLPKLKLDLRRAFTALRMTAGDRWPEIRENIMEDRDF